jgi:hypothetical protein
MAGEGLASGTAWVGTAVLVLAAVGAAACSAATIGAGVDVLICTIVSVGSSAAAGPGDACRGSPAQAWLINQAPPASKNFRLFISHIPSRDRWNIRSLLYILGDHPFWEHSSLFDRFKKEVTEKPPNRFNLSKYAYPFLTPHISALYQIVL